MVRESFYIVSISLSTFYAAFHPIRPYQRSIPINFIPQGVEDSSASRHLDMTASPNRGGNREMPGIAACARVFALLGFAGCARPAQLNTLTFANQSGSDALVKTVGATRDTVPVANDSRASIQIASGRYYILVRYGVVGHYTYSRGREFSVEGGATSYSEVTITLHKVVNGNYVTTPATQAEFDRR
jgi:hypothetical protein